MLSFSYGHHKGASTVMYFIALIEQFLFQRKFDKNESCLRWRWLVLLDDDSMIGVSKILDLVKRYDDQTSEPIGIGEMFGKDLIFAAAGGFEYIGGGAGKIFNRMAVHKLVDLATDQSCANAG